MQLFDKIPAIFSINSQKKFNELTLSVFQYQIAHNLIYRNFVQELNVNVSKIKNYREIPFLPISFFKNKVIRVGEKTEKIFLSSGTTKTRSEHHVFDLKIYEQSFTKTFSLFFGDPKNKVILCLLPSYQEQGNSSLIYMTNELIKQSNNPSSGYFLNEDDKLASTLTFLEKNEIQYVLFGVSYALLNYMEKYQHTIKYGKIIETGGMKGKRKEITKEQLHTKLQEGFGTQPICSEYGMTELLSQAYSVKNQEFNSPPWMKIVIRDASDPFYLLPPQKTGLINIIDLANVYSCPFIATDDVGQTTTKNGFKVLGRYDYSDLRGCNLLVQ